MKILIVTDAWKPQINGVVRTLENTRRYLEKMGYEVKILSPDNFWSIPCPTYPEIKVAWGVAPVGNQIREIDPDAIHITTEGPLGLSVRAWCVWNKFPFTTSFTTRFPEYISMRFPVPSGLSYQYFKWFHSAASATMIATDSLEKELEDQGFTNIRRWSRGVDVDVFCPWCPYKGMGPSPVMLYTGRVAVEKNLRDFLNIDIPGTKVVAGNGPDLEALKNEYPEVIFKGALSGEDLADIYASADVFVFPSRTDTFGIVMLEALASGVPVAAYPVTGPRDILTQGVTGYMDEDLGKAVEHALTLDRAKCRDAALERTWEKCTKQFTGNLDFRKEVSIGLDMPA